MKKIIKKFLKDKKGAILLEVLTSMTIVTVVILGFASFSIISIKNFNVAFRTSKAMQSVMKKAVSGSFNNEVDIKNGNDIKLYINLKDKNGLDVNIPINIGEMKIDEYEVEGNQQDIDAGYNYVFNYSDKIKAYKISSAP